jgi:hypothetical protein
LEESLDDLRGLGEVKQQSISAEDVSTQLVDLQARLRNLRKSEEALLEIMERSGSISDVLAVNQQLSSVREQIERHDAQVKTLENQIAYSTVSLTLSSPRTLVPQDTIAETLTQTWPSATGSVRKLSVGMLKLLIWSLVFSPYLGVLLLLGRVVQFSRRQHRSNEQT